MSSTNILPDTAATAQRVVVQRVPKSTLVARRFARNKSAVAGLVIFLLLALLAVVGPFVARFAYDDLDFGALKQPPSTAHWLGTDIVGADMFALTIRGLGRSLLIGLIASLGITVIAAFVGTSIAYVEGWREKAVGLGFAGVMSGPLVRSSYRAGRLYAEALARRNAQSPAPVSP